MFDLHVHVNHVHHLNFTSLRPEEDNFYWGSGSYSYPLDPIWNSTEAAAGGSISCGQ